MRKIILLTLSICLCLNLFAQLEVADTVLLADKNGNFWSASSELEQGIYKDLGKYGPVNLSDSDPMTCWAEGVSGDGTGEFILTTIPENITQLRIRNGYQKNEKLYLANNRPKKLEFSVFACYQLSGYVTETHTGYGISEVLYTSTAILKDTMGYQNVYTDINWPDIYMEQSHDNTFPKDIFILKIKILDVYKGNKWDDACISDINIVPSPYYNVTTDEQGFIKVFDYKVDTLFYNPESIYQVLEISPNGKWVIFIEMPADIENSRAETIYHLYSIEKEDFVEIIELTEMFDFSVKDDKTFIEGITKDFEDKTILLDTLQY